MSNLNKVMLMGRVGADPEVRHLESGSAVASVRLAISEKYKDRNGQMQENTEWHDIELWEGLAKIVEQYVKKGDLLFVEGKLKTDSWQDKDGNNRKTIRIRATDIRLMPKGNAGGGSGGGSYAAPQSSGAPSGRPAPQESFGGNDTDDLPF